MRIPQGRICNKYLTFFCLQKASSPLTMRMRTYCSSNSKYKIYLLLLILIHQTVNTILNIVGIKLTLFKALISEYHPVKGYSGLNAPYNKLIKASRSPGYCLLPCAAPYSHFCQHGIII